MNLELLESFGQNYPEEFDGSLDCISLGLFIKKKTKKSKNFFFNSLQKNLF